MTIHTAGQLRGFLADVLIDIRAKRIAPDEAAAIAKVAGEINRSLAVEVATALQAGVKKPVPGSMVIASATELPGNSGELPEGAGSDILFDECTGQSNLGQLTDESGKSPVSAETRVFGAEKLNGDQTQNKKPATLEDATANFARNRDGDKIWCEQCDMRVTVGQAVGCKSPHCKAKEAA